MKKILFIISIILINIGCTKKKEETNNQISTMTNKSIPQDKQINYIVDLTLKTPHELYINDILIASESRGSNAAIEVNPYILKNGKYKIKLKLFPFWQLNETHLNLDKIKNSRLFFGNYIKNRETDKTISYNADIPLTINIPNQSIPYFEQEWEVEIKDLPYKLEGWSKGQDLSKMNQEELEQKVVNYHKMIWQILNDGNSDKWINLISERFKEITVFDYISNTQASLDIQGISEDVEKYAKNTMIPMEDYEMKLYAEGKLVTLERKTHTREFNNQSPLDIKSWSPLISKGKISGAADYPIKLYLPEGSDEFVIIRK